MGRIKVKAIYKTVFRVEYTNRETENIIADGYSEVMEIIRKSKRIPDDVENIFDDYVWSVSRGERVRIN